MERLEFMVDDQLRAEGAIAKFRAGQIEIISLLEFVIGKFVADGEAYSIRPGVVADQIYARHFRFLAAVFGVTSRSG